MPRISLTRPADASENIAYGHQTIDFDSSNFGQSVDQFFTSNVTVDNQPLNLTTNPLIANDLSTDIIDKLQSNGQAEQQILLLSIAGTNIQDGVIDIDNVAPWAGLESLLFDASNFDPGAMFPDAALTSAPFDFLF
jgi:hypothetical protein